MRIEVTADDIANGKQRSCGQCPLALAITRAIGSPAEVTLVHVYGIHQIHPIAAIPHEAQVFVMGFDAGRLVEPFAFDLDIPEAPPCA